jgi:branched-chain amino acid transport system ATP-binding protein
MSKALLQVNDASKHFGGLTAVNRVTFSLEEGEILGLIGPNGAGKSTLFNMISGYYRPDGGSVKFAGDDITGTPPHLVCQRGLVRTFQIVKPFANLTVAENVMVGSFLRRAKVQESNQRARQVLEFVGLSQYADQPANNLTTAGRKRLELARALATQPRLLLLDEVMAGLTPTESRDIVSLIQKIRESGVTILVIEHVMKAIMALSDRVAVLHHGELIAIDTPVEITRNSEVITAYLGGDHDAAHH